MSKRIRKKDIATDSSGSDLTSEETVASIPPPVKQTPLRQPTKSGGSKSGAFSSTSLKAGFSRVFDTVFNPRSKNKVVPSKQASFFNGRRRLSLVETAGGLMQQTTHNPVQPNQITERASQGSLLSSIHKEDSELKHQLEAILNMKSILPVVPQTLLKCQSFDVHDQYLMEALSYAREENFPPGITEYDDEEDRVESSDEDFGEDEDEFGEFTNEPNYNTPADWAYTTSSRKINAVISTERAKSRIEARRHLHQQRQRARELINTNRVSVVKTRAIATENGTPKQAERRRRELAKKVKKRQTRTVGFRNRSSSRLHGENPENGVSFRSRKPSENISSENSQSNSSILKGAMHQIQSAMERVPTRGLLIKMGTKNSLFSSASQQSVK